MVNFYNTNKYKMKTVVILSLPRSGSSLLAGILHNLGIWMGKEEDLKKGKHLNKYGCYENQSIEALILNILFYAKRLIDYSKRLENDELIKKAIDKYKLKIKKTIKENEKKLWGFKSPSAIYVIPYFHHFLKNPYYICLFRDVRSIAKSIGRTTKFRNWLPELKKIWEYFTFLNFIKFIFRLIKLSLRKGNLFSNYQLQIKVAENGYERIKKFIRDKKHITVYFDELINEPEHTINKIINFLEINPPPGQIEKAINFINPNLITC